jgi:hypothetical protein
LIYDKANILNNIAKNDRLIEPSFDNPEEHLAFNPEFYFYESKTKMGEITNHKFFNHKEIVEEFEKLSRFIQSLIINLKDKQIALETVKSYIDLHGKESVCLRFYEYWLQRKRRR